MTLYFRDNTRPMNLLAFDTSTDTLFIAVQHGQGVWQYQGPGGAQASASLIPTVRNLMQQAGLSFDTLDAIVFGRGPGSFTGLRTACAVAQGLAFGARGGQGVPVLPVDTLLAVAEEARLQHGCTQVMAVLDARMDEVYHAHCEWHEAEGQWTADAEFGLSAPQSVLVPAGWTVAGNARAAYGERLAPAALHVHALPTATAMLRLAPALLAAGEGIAASDALPRYIRDKVAKTTAERDALRAAQATPTP
ncbi:tRNA threonylcarbamoyladenosine biosynthesis protein TsaB [Acidovorax sp. 69]|nr:tRNA threonylcarbamoyladenosine biosynthesis protein TsaB [Acidovorax sp. 69]